MHILGLESLMVVPTPFRAVWAQDINTISLSAAACPLQRQTSVGLLWHLRPHFLPPPSPPLRRQPSPTPPPPPMTRDSPRPVTNTRPPALPHTDDQCGHTRRAYVHPDAQYPAQATFARTLTVEAKPRPVPCSVALSPLPGARSTLRARPYGRGTRLDDTHASAPAVTPSPSHAVMSTPPFSCSTSLHPSSPHTPDICHLGASPRPGLGYDTRHRLNAQRLPALAPRFAIAGVVSVYTPLSPSQTLTCSRSALSPSFSAL
ncbi:hypothetical protein B0H14DRAFT_2733237 [Mycena olivaceomarginata]|nr:hypothetical protein B0H14DRAFT_2733237 [Mycena olivaceomarginata]